MTDSELQQKRFVAAVVDIAVAVGIMVLFGVCSWAFLLLGGRATHGAAFGYVARILSFGGSLVGLGYVLARDVLAGGNSLGKKTQGLRVLRTTGEAITFQDSAKRNAFFAIGSVLGLLSATLGLVPCLGDMVNCLLLPLRILGVIAALAVAVVEIIKITQDPNGVRLGDQFASTRVVRAA